jgi:TldD protein
VARLLLTREGGGEIGSIFQETGYCQAAIVAAARKDDNIQRAFETAGDTRSGFGVARRIDEKVEQVGRRAVELLSAPRVKAGRYPVVLDNKLAGVFVHEAFGHLSEADHVCENEQARQMMVLGRKFAPDYFSVYDDATLEGHWGSSRYDDEGTPTAPTPLIVNGELTGRLHSRYTAARLGERPTGNAYAINYQHAPIVRMTNTYVASGRQNVADLIGPIKEGVYACGAFGGQTMLENFSFSAAHARMIRDGELAEPVRDVVLSGNLFQTLGNVTGLGDEMRMESGGCGKGGQAPKPVGIGAPHMRIDDVLIGGA